MGCAEEPTDSQIRIIPWLSHSIPPGTFAEFGRTFSPVARPYRRQTGTGAEAASNRDRGLVRSGAGTELELGDGRESPFAIAGEDPPASDEPTSLGRTAFRNGATIFPRFLFFVMRQAAGPLGRAAGKAGVRRFSGITTRNRGKTCRPWKVSSRQSSSGRSCWARA